MSDQNVSPNVTKKKKPPTVQDGPSSGFKRTKRWVDFTFGYGGVSPVVAGPTGAVQTSPGGSLSGDVPTNIGEPSDFDENFPVERPDVPELSEGITPEIYDNSVLGGFTQFMDNIVPDDLGGMVTGKSGWLSNVPGYQQTVGAALSVPLDAGATAIDAINWGAEQMNHLGSALVSWLPGGIQTLDWEQSQDVSFGQAFVASMGATAGRMERGEAQVGDWMMLPFSLISLGAAQIDTDNIAQDKDFSVLNQEQLQKAFSSGAGMWTTGGLDAAWLVASDPLILLGGASTAARLGVKGTKFGGLTNQALKKVNQVNRMVDEDLLTDATLIAERGVDGARQSGELSASGEHLIAAMQGNATDLTNHVWATGENASRQKDIIKFLANDTDVADPIKSARVVGALMGHAPSWRAIREMDADLYDRLSTVHYVDNIAPAVGKESDAIATANGGLAPLSDEAIKLGDDIIDQAKESYFAPVKDDPFDAFERQFGTNLDYSDDAARQANEITEAVVENAAIADGAVPAGQLITRGGARIAPGMVRAANAWRSGKSRSQFATAKRPVAPNASITGKGHFVYDFIEKTSSSRPITAIRWVGQGTPSGIVFLKGDDGQRGVREVTNWLRKSPIDADASAIFLNRFVGERTEAGRALILQEMEREAVARIAAKHGSTPKNAEKLFDAYARKRDTALQTARSSKNLFYRDDQTGEMVTLPSFYAEIGNATPMLDTKLFEKVVKKNKISLGLNEVSGALDSINTIWKVSVLLRLGYTQRNIVEGFLRSSAVIGLAATNPKALAAIPVNAYYYAGMKRGLRTARKTEKDLNMAIKNLQEARELVSGSKTKTGRIRKGKQEQLTEAEKRQQVELENIDRLSEELREAINVVRYKNSKRKKTGVGSNQVAPGVYYAGAFDGTEGEIARKLASADRTYSNTILSKAQRQIDEYSDLVGFKEIDPSKISAKQMDQYWAAYAERINRRYVNDPFVQLILTDAPISKIRNFFKTPEGVEYFDQIQATGGATTRWSDVDAYISESIRRIDYEVPPNSELRALTVQGEQLMPGDVAAAMSKMNELPIIPGVLSDPGATTVFGLAKRGFNFGINESMKWLGSIPETNLLRHPFYNSVYKSRQKELYELAARQGQDMGSPIVKSQINKSARSDALRATNETMYTIQELSNTAVLLRWVSPFFPAWENSMRTWGRIVYNNPAVLGVGNVLWNIPNNLGWVVDENGDKVENSNFLRDDGTYIVWPEPMAKISRKKFGPFLPGESVMTRQSGLNVVFPGGEWWFPGVGPMTQIPTALLLRGKPEDQEIIKQALGENIYRQIVPNGNPNTDLIDALIPTVARRVKQQWGGESSDSAYLTLKNTMVEDAYIKAQLEGRALTEKDLLEVDKRADDFWKWQINIAVTGFTASHPYVSPYKLQRDTWNKLIDDQSLTYQEKIGAFLDTFNGDTSFLAITRSGSENETGLKPNLRTWKRIYENKGLVNELYNIDPKLVGMFGNMGHFDDPFSYAVYGEYGGMTIGDKTVRNQMTSRELARNNQITDGWREWSIIKDTAEERARDLGLSSLQVKGASNLRDMLKAAEADLTAKYPAWGVEKETYESNLGNFIQGARMMVQNADLVDEDTTIYALRQYLEVREAIVSKLETVTNDDARQKVKEMGYAAAFELRQSDIGFADFYDQYLAFDDFREI